MDTAIIKLGAIKRLLGKPLCGVHLRGFFYGCGVANITLNCWCGKTQGRPGNTEAIALLSIKSSRKSPLPAKHLILQNNFLHIPSKKRDAQCTNILHTGATLSGVGEGQRLRKGFQEQRRIRVRLFIEQKQRDAKEIPKPKTSAKRASLDTTLLSMLEKLCLFFESLSSAAEIRHLAKNTRL